MLLSVKKFSVALKKTLPRADPMDMKAEQFIEFANDFAKEITLPSSQQLWLREPWLRFLS